MKKNLIISVLILFILISSSSNAITLYDGGLWQPRVEITNIDAPDYQKVGDSFKVKLTVRNDKLYPVRVSIQINLLDGMLSCIRKNIDINKTVCYLKVKQTETFDIDCKIREGDIDWYKEKYNVEAVVFRDYMIRGSGHQLDSTVQGIHIKSKLTEKNKVKIESINVTEYLKEGDENDNFVADVWVKNDGCYDFDTWVRIDLIEKPSAIPELEEYIDLKALVATRKEIGRYPKDTIKSIGLGCEEPVLFKVPCDLRLTEIRKEQFNIEAVLFVIIDGIEYQVDTSTLYGIYHKQPICQDEICWILAIAIIFAVLISIGIIAFIIRILYPLYYKKKNELRKDMISIKIENEENKINQLKEKEKKYKKNS